MLMEQKVDETLNNKSNKPFQMTVTNLSLELASDPATIKYTHWQNSFNWKAKLSHEQYMEREWRIGVESEQCKRDDAEQTGIYHFILRDLTIDAGDDNCQNIVASCETRNRKAWRAHKGVLKQIISPCIGSVYTLPLHRKKGYAGKMIKLLNEYWVERLDPDSFIFLFSEIGHYYTKMGYNSHEVKVHKLPVPREIPETLDLDYTTLEFEKYGDLINLESKKLIENLVNRSKTTDVPVFSLDMDLDTFTWFHLRDRFIGSKVSPDFKLERFGAELKDGSRDHVIWLHDWNDDSLTILKLKFSSLNSFKFLLNLAFSEAKAAKLHEIDLWDSSLGKDETLYRESFDYVKSIEGAVLHQDNDSLSAMRLNSLSKDYIWENNDKWCWF